MLFFELSHSLVYDGPHCIVQYADGVATRKFIYGPGIDEPLMMRVHIPEGPDEDYYYHRDALGNVMALSDENGNIVEGYTYSAFGCTIVNTDDGADNDWLTPESGSMAAVSQVGNPYLFTGRRFDPESGLYYYRVRYYDPALGRFISADPISYAGGINLYAYVLNNPINWIDPWGLHKIVYNGATITVYDDDGNVVYTCPATSGKPGVDDEGIPNQGPIPDGDYYIIPSEVSRRGYFRRVFFDNMIGADWGHGRVPVHPYDSTDTHGRGGFFLHGGMKPGSAGCIDVGIYDNEVLEIIENHDGNVELHVEKVKPSNVDGYVGHEEDPVMWSDWPNDVPIPG